MQAVVKTAHQASYADPIAFKQGERVHVTEKRELWKDIHVWIWCVNQAGEEGWVPEQYLEVHGSSSTANRDYDAVELDIEEGDYLDVLEEVSGWCRCRDAKGKTGWVPTENIRIFTASR